MSESTVKLLNNPYGQVTFNLFRQEEQAFVDKSLMIKFLDDKGMSKYPVLLRPRRFGKSTFVQMLKCYYDISYRDRYEELFSGTKIYEENLPTHNSYHVIDFDFSAVSTGNLNKLLTSFFVAVADGISDFKRRYKDFDFDYSKLDRTDATTLFNEFAIAYKDYSDSQTLYVMIDEYDNFANEILSKDLDLFLHITSKDGFLKTFYSAIKNHAKNTIAKTFITGVSSVSLDSLTSGFNIARNVTSRTSLNEYAGFTEDELNILIPKLVDVAKLGVTTKEIIERMKPVYDGYCFSAEADKTVYNSSMCLYYLDMVREKGVFLNPEDYLDPASDQDGSKLSQLFNLTQKETAEFIIDTYLQGGVFYVSKLSENINLNQVREYSLEQLLSMLYYLGYLTIDREKSSLSGLALKIPNRFMSKLFARCTIDFSFKNNTEFKAPKLNLSALTSCEDDISSFAESCSEFLSRIMNNQVLSHMNEMALNLALYAKLETMPIVNTYVKMQQSVQVPKEGERFPDLVITVNKGLPDECIYLIELKYLKKTEARDKNSESILKRAIKDATAELTAYKSAIDFKGRNIKAYAMVFAGADCVYCQKY
ncbi:AAA family ATPase [Succinivibrio dextrinosolvens]|uniref:PD-(D/E)XK nuclease superfamily protein n=1 Tax=Succinivibrio dextrinosolvens TaxID=83771 RepID=A0A662ZBZ2_9GAMM|nr:AAA family ATPase [Succinivibrio dextrinosolvens]SFK38874.1 PD-(D/E)XK nuclease superfamily protein [Succinivibrio dextrinosolvens]